MNQSNWKWWLHSGNEYKRHGKVYRMYKFITLGVSIFVPQEIPAGFRYLRAVVNGLFIQDEAITLLLIGCYIYVTNLWHSRILPQPQIPRYLEPVPPTARKRRNNRRLLRNTFPHSGLVTVCDVCPINDSRNGSAGCLCIGSLVRH